MSTETKDIPSSSVGFFESRVFLKQRRVAIRTFSGLCDTDFDKKLWYTPLFSYPKTFSKPEVFWNTEGFPYETFRFCERKNLTKNCDTRPSSFILKTFRYPKFSETKEGSPTKLFGTVSQKLGKNNVINTPLLLSKNIFDTRSFLKLRRVPLRIFLVLWDKNFEKNWDTRACSFIHKIFRYPKFSETQTCSPTKLLDSVGQKINSRK